MITGPRGRWVAVAIWLLIGAAGLLAHAHIDDVTAAGQSSFLPADSESTRALEALHATSGAEDVPVVIVFERPGGLAKGDLQAIGRIGDGLGELGLTGHGLDRGFCTTPGRSGQIRRLDTGPTVILVAGGPFGL